MLSYIQPWRSKSTLRIYNVSLTPVVSSFWFVGPSQQPTLEDAEDYCANLCSLNLNSLMINYDTTEGNEECVCNAKRATAWLVNSLNVNDHVQDALDAWFTYYSKQLVNVASEWRALCRLAHASVGWRSRCHFVSARGKFWSHVRLVDVWPYRGEWGLDILLSR